MLLINGGLQIDSPDAEGRHVMHWAAINEDTAVLEALLRSCVGYEDLLASLLGQADSFGLSPLHWAVHHGNTNAARMLIASGGQVSAVDDDGKTALHWTSTNETRECADLILGSDPNVVNTQDGTGRTALHAAIGDQNLPVMRAILAAAGNDPSLADDSGRTPLHWTVTMGQIELVEAMVDSTNSNGNNIMPNIAKADGNGATPLHYAAQHDQVDIIEVLLKHGPDDLHAVVDADGRGPLMWAISQGHLKAIRALLQVGADPMLADADGRTSLHAAAFVDDAKVVEVLLGSGSCHVDAPDAATGQTALIAAAELGAARSVSALLAGRADPFAGDSEMKCALHHAAIGGHVEVLNLLLAPLDGSGQRTWPNPIDQRGETPIHYACFYGHTEAVALLIAEAEVQFDCQDYDGVSPLHWGAMQGHYAAVEQLLAAGCYPNYQELREEMPTPLDYANQSEDHALAELLVSYGAVTSLAIQAHAATTIQAAVRGFFARKAVDKMRASRKAAKALLVPNAAAAVDGTTNANGDDHDAAAATPTDGNDGLPTPALVNTPPAAAAAAAPTDSGGRTPKEVLAEASEKDPSEWGLATLEMHVRMSMESLVSGISGTSGVSGQSSVPTATAGDGGSGEQPPVETNADGSGDAVSINVSSGDLPAEYNTDTPVVQTSTADVDAGAGAEEAAAADKPDASQDDTEAALTAAADSPANANASASANGEGNAAASATSAAGSTNQPKKRNPKNQKKPWERDPLLLTKRKSSVADLDDDGNGDGGTNDAYGSSDTDAAGSSTAPKTALFNRTAGKVTVTKSTAGTKQRGSTPQTFTPARKHRDTGIAFEAAAPQIREARDSVNGAQRRGKRATNKRPGGKVQTSISTDWMKQTNKESLTLTEQNQMTADAQRRNAALEAKAEEDAVDINARARMRAHSALHYRKVFESERVRHVRNYIQAAIAIQRAYRKHLAWKAEMGMPTGGNGLYDSYPSKQSIMRARSAASKPLRPSMILNVLSPRYDSTGRKVASSTHASERKVLATTEDMAPFLSTPSFGTNAENQLSKKQREIAVLVIQLWWRRAKTRKWRRENGLHRDDPALLQGAAANQLAESAAMANAMRTKIVYRPKTAVTLWRPGKFAVGLSTADTSKPSAAVKSFNAAVTIFAQSRGSYLEPKSPHSHATTRRVASAKVSASRQQKLRQLYGTVDLQSSRPKSAPAIRSPEHRDGRGGGGTRRLLPQIDTPHPRRGKSAAARRDRRFDFDGKTNSNAMDTDRSFLARPSMSPLNARRTFAASRRAGRSEAKFGHASHSRSLTSQGRSAAVDSSSGSGTQPSKAALRQQMRQITSNTAQQHINRRGLDHMEVGMVGLAPKRPQSRVLQPQWSSRW